jgi:hypothetical protein
MATVSVTSTATSIPGRAGRKKLVFTNAGTNTVYWAWESTVTATGSTKGIPLPAQDATSGGPVVLLDGAEVGTQKPIYLVCASGQTATVIYTEMA